MPLNLRRILPESLRPKSKSIFLWGLLGLSIRLAIMPLLGHADSVIQAWKAILLLSTHQLIPSVDPPLVAFMYASYLAPLLPIVPSGIARILTDPTQYSPAELRITLAMIQPGLGTFLFLLKTPLLAFDLVAAIGLLWIPERPERAVLAYKLWMLNPVGLFVTFAMGQYDIAAVSLFIVALGLVRHEKYFASAAVLGAAGAFKMVGILFLIPLSIYYAKRAGGAKGVFRGILMLGVGLIVALAGLSPAFFVPQYYQSANLALSPARLDGYYQNTLYSQGVPGSSFLSGLLRFAITFSASFSTPGSNEQFIIIPMVYALLLYFVATQNGWSYRSLANAFMGFLFAYYSFSLFLPQWFLWVQPLIVLWVADLARGARTTYILTSALFFVYIWKWGGALTIGLLTPIDARFQFMSGPDQWLNSVGIPADQFLWVVRAFLAAALLYGILFLAREAWFRNFLGRRGE